MIQTMKQITKSVPRIPCPNIVPRASIQQMPFDGSPTVDFFPHQFCSVADTSVVRSLNFSGLRTSVGS
jgi:hypothetical protein